MLIDLTERDASLLRRMLDAAAANPPEQLARRQQTKREPNKGAIKAFVEITSTTKQDGRYPGTIYDRYDAATDTWTAGGDCWVVDSLGTTLATGKKYEGRLAGYAGTPEYLVYVTDRDASGGSGITSLNGLTAATQTFAVGTAGTDFAVSSSTSTHTFNLPDAYNTTRGVVSDGTQVFAGTKVFAKSYIMIGTDGFTEYGSVGPGSGTADHVWVQHQTSAPYVGLGIQDYSEGDAEFQVWGPGNSLHADGIAVMTGSPNGGHSVNGPAFGVLVEGPIYRVGVYGTGGAGDKYAGGICYELGSGGVSIGDAVGSGTANYVLFVDGSGNLAQSSDFQWDDTAKSLTLGTSGYLVTTKSSAPSGIATGAIAGPFTTS